jgi:hypothetical protein
MSENIIEKRAEARHRVLKGGRLAFHGGGGVNCTVRNISRTGARIPTSTQARSLWAPKPEAKVRSSGQFWPSQPVTSESLITVNPPCVNPRWRETTATPLEAVLPVTSLLAVPELIRSADIKLNQQA